MSDIIGTGNAPQPSFVTPASNTIYQALSTNGDGTGFIEQKVNGGTSPVKFYIQPAVDEVYILKRVNIAVIASNFNDATKYGTLSLVNGIEVFIENDIERLQDYTKDITIKRTYDWGLLSGVDAVTVGNANADPFLVRWTFDRGGTNIKLNGANNERFVMQINDDLTGLISQVAMIQGFKNG